MNEVINGVVNWASDVGQELVWLSNFKYLQLPTNDLMINTSESEQANGVPMQVLLLVFFLLLTYATWFCSDLCILFKYISGDNKDNMNT